MNELYVCVRLFGAVVDHAVVPVVDGMRLGEAPGAVVTFPGADLVVRQRDGNVFVRGRRLDEDDVFAMSLGHVDVTLEVIRHEVTPGDVEGLWRRLENAFGAPIQPPDWRLLVATAAIALIGSTWDAMNGFLATNPVAAHTATSLQSDMQALMEQIELAAEPIRSARIRAPEAPTEARAPNGAAGDPAGRGPGDDGTRTGRRADLSQDGALSDAPPDAVRGGEAPADWPPAVRVRVE